MLTAKKVASTLLYIKSFPWGFSPLYKGELHVTGFGVSPIISLLNNSAFALVAVLNSR